MMNALLSSVSYAAMSAGGGGDYPTSPTLTSIYADTDDVNSSLNKVWTVNFTEAGSYAVAIYGGTGGAGDTDSNLDNPTTISGDATINMVGYAENQDYEVISFYDVRINTPGNHDITYDQESTRFRISIEVWRAKAANLAIGKTLISTAGGTSVTVTDAEVIANQGYIAVYQGRGASPVATSPGLTNEPLTIDESDFRTLTETGVFSVTQSESFTVSGSSTNRAQVGLWRFPYLTFSESIGLSLQSALTYVVSGSDKDGIAVKNAPTYVLLNQAGGTRLHVNNGHLYVVGTN